MPVFELTLDDGRRLHIDADDQQAALNGYQQFRTQETTAPGAGVTPKGSGIAAAVQHAIPELIRSNQETAHQFYSASAPKPSDPNYTPANLTNGSANPLNWNWSQAGQKAVEMTPGLTQDVAAGTIAAKGAKGAGLGVKMSALAGLVGSGLSMWNRSAGDTTREAAQARTGNGAEEPNSDDRMRGGLTAAASAAIGALTPARLIPGANKVTSVGGQGTFDATKKYLATTAIGAGSSTASDAVTQVGTTIGTKDGVQYDPARGIEAAGSGGIAGFTLASPKYASDLARSASYRKYGGENVDASANYATRLQNAGDGKLGSPKVAAAAHETVIADLRNELSNAAKNVRRDVPLSPEADNALQRAQRGGTLTPADLAIIQRDTAAAPDGANAAYLVRTLHVADMAQGRGSYDGGRWAGGFSGALDKNMPSFVKPTNLMLGSAASGLGLHLIGASNPMLAASGVGAYGATRAIDALTGMRSPGRAFAERFASHNAQLRLPATPQASPQATGGPASPWGPRPPVSGPTGPLVPPPAVPRMAAAPGPWGGRPLPTTSVPAVSQVAPQGISTNTKALTSGIAYVQKMKATADAITRSPEAATQLQGSAQDTAAQLIARVSGPAKAERITKEKGKVESSAPFVATGGYEPIPTERMMKLGMSPEQMAQQEVDSYMPTAPQLRRMKYYNSVMDTLAGRRDVVELVQRQHPQEAPALQGLLRQLYELGSSRKRALQAINHYAGLMSPEAGKALKDQFASQLDRLWQK